MIKIIIPNYPIKVQVTKGRRKKYFQRGDKIPKKYLGDNFLFKEGKLYNRVDKIFIIKNESVIDKPRFASLSYNQIGARDRITILMLLKAELKKYIPEGLNINPPVRVECKVYDLPTPLHKDLDNMHIYYKAFLDLLTGMGYLPDDSKQYVTKAGGFEFVPIKLGEERRLVFEILEDDRDVIQNHVMFNLEQRTVSRINSDLMRGIHLESSTTLLPGAIEISKEKILIGVGKTKIIPAACVTAMKRVFEACMNLNTSVWVTEGFYRAYNTYVQDNLLSKGVIVAIKIDDK